MITSIFGVSDCLWGQVVGRTVIEVAVESVNALSELQILPKADLGAYTDDLPGL